MSELDRGVAPEPVQEATPEQPITPAEEALRRVTAEIETGTAKLGWDRPPAVYALVPTSQLLATPHLPADIAEQVRQTYDGSPQHLSAILQESALGDELESTLLGLAWPDTVAGAAVTAERVVLPPSAESDMPADPDAAAEYAAEHADRTEIRITAAALRSGETWSMLRMRPYDDDAAVGTGPALIPSLTAALQSGFAPE